MRVYTPNGPGALPACIRACRIVAGHPEGFHEAFANVYSASSEAIAARRTVREPDPLALQFPTERAGAFGVKFVVAAVASRVAHGLFTDARRSLRERYFFLYTPSPAIPAPPAPLHASARSPAGGDRAWC